MSTTRRLARRLHDLAILFDRADRDGRFTGCEVYLAVLEDTLLNLSDALAGLYESPDVQREVVLRAVRRGRRHMLLDDPACFACFTPADIRDEHGRFLPKTARERIYRAWREHGSTDDVAWFLALAPASVDVPSL
jgi:hypothetical protein